jgi:hypothetical protein
MKTDSIRAVACIRFVRRLFCKHALAWVRNIYGDEINATNARTLWICEKCEKLIYDRDYITREMACVVYSPPNKALSEPHVD